MNWRPWPRSLAGQLVWILFGGVTLSLFSSAAIHLYDRNQAVSYLGSLQTAQRFAGIVQALDPLSDSERATIVTILEMPLQFVRILKQRPAAKKLPQEDEHALHLKQQMIRFLGPDRPLQVEIISIQEDWGNRKHPRPRPHSPRTGANTAMMMPMAGLHHGAHMSQHQKPQNQGVSFIARTQLQDGTWLEFHNHLPEEAFTWPWHLLWSLIILFIVVTSFSVLAVRLITRPLARLAAAARSLGHDLRRPPLTESGSVEVQNVVSAFNAMQARLIQFIQERSTMLAAVSHDLQTPLTRMRLRVEMLKDDTLKMNLLRNLEEMENLTEATMDYIQGAEGLEEVRLTDILSLLEELQEAWQEMGHHVVIQCSDIPAFPLMGKSFRRALTNLIQNAIKYGQQAHIRATLHGEQLRITVADDGTGIPEDKMATVLRPFKRLDSSRNRKTGGTGLGLSIAHNIIRAHGGMLLLRNRPEGGLEVIITVPRGAFSQTYERRQEKELIA